MNIFISYRRQDSSGQAGRLVDSLKQYFREDEIFIDIETIQPGLDFKEVIENYLQSCDVLLALIGPEWIHIKSASGRRRIDDPDDFIRLEISEALKRSIRVIPVLVDGADLPESSELPDDLKGLTRRQAFELSNKRWKFDVEALANSLRPKPPIPNPKPNPGPPPQPQPEPFNPPPNPAYKPQQPKNWLVESILATLLCCPAFGIVGIINATKVDSLYRTGDFAGAGKASRDAGKWAKIAFFTGLVIYVIYFLLILMGALNSPTSSEMTY